MCEHICLYLYLSSIDSFVVLVVLLPTCCAGIISKCVHRMRFGQITKHWDITWVSSLFVSVFVVLDAPFQLEALCGLTVMQLLQLVSSVMLSWNA